MGFSDTMKQFMRLYRSILGIWQLYGLLFAALSCQFVIYFVGLIPSKLSKSLVDRDLDYFKSVTIQALLLLMLNALAIAVVKFLETRMYIRFRKSLTKLAVNYYFSKDNYYQLSQSLIDNSDQRLTMDIERFSRKSCTVISVLVVLPFTMGWYIYKCVLVTGWLGPVSCFIFFITGSLISQIAMPFVIRESRKVESREGDYRWKHAKTREHAENIAMSRAGNKEKDLTLGAAESLFNTQNSMANKSFFLDCAVNLFDYLGGILSYLCLAPLVFGGDYDDKDPGELTEIIGANAFVIIYLVNQFTRIFDQFQNLADIIATGQRISQMINFCIKSNKNVTDDQFYSCDTVVTDSNTTNRNELIQTSNTNEIVVSVNNLYLEQSNDMIDRKYLISNLSFSLTKGENLLISGPNGIGKTSFIRLCNGIWKKSSGEIRIPSKTMFVSQKPLITNGTLKSQVVYPNDPYKYTDQDVKDALDRVQLSYLTLSDIELWDKILSTGEQQKLALSRIFLQKPDLVFLDESTSGLPEEDEEKIYKSLIELEIQIISVAHRTNLRQFHARFLQLKPDSLYEFH